jgi:hypothetical protein
VLNIKYYSELEKLLSRTMANPTRSRTMERTAAKTGGFAFDLCFTIKVAIRVGAQTANPVITMAIDAKGLPFTIKKYIKMLIARELANHPPPTTRIRAMTSTLVSLSNSLHDLSTASAW